MLSQEGRKIFFGSRLSIARRRRKLSKVELARRVELARETLVRIEGGDEQPSTTTAEKLCFALSFPLSFFYAGEAELLEEERVSFRALRSLPAKERDAALATGELALLLSEFLQERYKLPSLDLPELGGLAPEEAAAQLRKLWDLQDRPIGNMVHLLEAKGVQVYWLPEENREVDAFTFRNGNRAIVVLSREKEGEHGRMDAAHELGHLLLHRQRTMGGQQVETEAGDFAAAFLLPPAFLEDLPALPKLDVLLELKEIWGVSLQALLRRGLQLGRYPEWQYKAALAELSRKNWRQREPAPWPVEDSLTFQKLAVLLKKRRMGFGDLASEIHIGERELVGMLAWRGDL